MGEIASISKSFFDELHATVEDLREVIWRIGSLVGLKAEPKHVVFDAFNVI